MIRHLALGASTRRVLMKAGQPHARLDDTFTYCTRKPSGRTAIVHVVFDDRGRISTVN